MKKTMTRIKYLLIPVILLVALLIAFVVLAGKRSVDQPSLPSAQQQTPLPWPTENPADYVPLTSFSLTEGTQSPQFTTTGDYFQIKFDCPSQICRAYLYDVNEKERTPKGDIVPLQIVDAPGPLNSAKRINRKGTFYIKSSQGNISFSVENHTTN